MNTSAAAKVACPSITLRAIKHSSGLGAGHRRGLRLSAGRPLGPRVLGRALLRPRGSLHVLQLLSAHAWRLPQKP